MWSASSRELKAAGEEPTAETARWGREFFDAVRGALVPRMAPVAETPEGELRYLGSRAMRLWGFVSGQVVALAHEYGETPEQIGQRSRRWLGCLATRTAPGRPSPYWGHPLYGARLDPLSGRLEVVWAQPGDWCEAVLAGDLPEREWDAPRSWVVETVGAGEDSAPHGTAAVRSAAART